MGTMKRSLCIKEAEEWALNYVKKKFNAATEISRIIKWMKKWEEENGGGCNFYIGISGGKDSSIVAALLVKAFGKERVKGVLMPCGAQADIEDAKQIVRYLGINAKICNIEPLVTAQKNLIELAGGELSKQAIINIPPRVRMTTLYAFSQSDNGRVVNTCNRSEDYVGYSTRWGDSVGDFSPLSDYTVTEVKAIGRHLRLPPNLIDKVPADGLTNLADEDNLGFKYVVLDRYIRTGICEDPDAKAKIDSLHAKNLFKLLPMPVCTFNPKYETKI